MNKEQVLRESVKKLLELNISDKEIVENLKSVGVPEATAKKILEDTKNPAKESVPEPEKVESADDIYNRVYAELEGPLKTPVAEKPIKNPSYSSSYSSYSQQGNQNISELWEKGILATVDAKLDDMEKLKRDIDSEIEAVVREKVKIEMKKIDTVVDSQRALAQSRIDTHLEQKANELRSVLESRAKNLEDVHAAVKQGLAKMQAEKTFNTELLNNINEKITGLDSVKSRMISDTNASLIGMESKFSDFMADSKAKRDETESRINRALQLESKITEGLIDDARHKIEDLKLEKEAELTEKIQGKLSEFEAMARQVDPKGISERLAAMKELEKSIIARQKDIDRDFDSFTKQSEKQLHSDFAALEKEWASFKKDVAKLEDENLEELRKEYAANVDDLFAKNIVAWNKSLKEKEKAINVMAEKIDIEKFNATLESLDLFKQQFLNTVRKSIDDYNKTKVELAKTIIERDKAINDYIRRIDSKMQDLNDFEKRFAGEVASLIDIIPEEKIKKEKGPKKGK